MAELTLDAQVVPLASPEHCATFTAEARSIFGMGATPWKKALHTPVAALQHFHKVSGANCTMYAAAHAWTDRAGRPGSLVSLYIATEAAISRADLDALGAPLEGSGWSADGVHAAPDYAFPSLALHGNRLVHLWVDEPPHGPVCTLLAAQGAKARPEKHLWGRTGDEGFVGGAGHALGEWLAPQEGERQLKEQLKLAFAYRVAERVVEADGVVDDDELAYLNRTFPAAQLQALWLDDVALREQLAEQAEAELRQRIGYHEKLGLLSTFFGACYADGSISVQELKVLKEASEALGLERSEVVGYLQKLW